MQGSTHPLAAAGGTLPGLSPNGSTTAVSDTADKAPVAAEAVPGSRAKGGADKRGSASGCGGPADEPGCRPYGWLEALYVPCFTTVFCSEIALTVFYWWVLGSGYRHGKIQNDEGKKGRCMHG